MKRTGTNQPPRDAKLGDALPQQTKNQLSQLRKTLAEQAQRAAKDRLAESLPPWRRQMDERTASEVQQTGFAPGVKVVRVNAPPGPSKRTKRRAGRVPKVERPEFAYWELPSNAASLEPPPASISRFDRSRLNEVLNKGSERTVADGEHLFIVLGLDFGTP